MLLEVLDSARDLGRLHDIASVLIRHGFGDMVRRLGLAGVLGTAGFVAAVGCGVWVIWSVRRSSRRR